MYYEYFLFIHADRTTVLMYVALSHIGHHRSALPPKLCFTQQHQTNQQCWIATFCQFVSYNVRATIAIVSTVPITRVSCATIPARTLHSRPCGFPRGFRLSNLCNTADAMRSPRPCGPVGIAGTNGIKMSYLHHTFKDVTRAGVHCGSRGDAAKYYAATRRPRGPVVNFKTH